MLIRFLKRFWLLLVSIATLLTGLQVGLNIFPKIFRFSLIYINKMHYILSKPICITTNRFALIVLSLLFLALLLLCLINYFKNKIKIPKKDMIKFLIIFKNNAHLSIREIVNQLEFPIDRIRLYFDILLNEEYVLRTKNEFTNSYQYSLDQKGRIFLKKNKMLD